MRGVEVQGMTQDQEPEELPYEGERDDIPFSVQGRQDSVEADV